MTSESKVILVAEDELGVLALARGFLAEEGYEVLSAESGEQALALLAGAPNVDLVFTDIVMPGVNGFAIARRAVAAMPGVRVLYTTGYLEQLQQNDALVARGDLLPKPYRLAQLGARVGQLLHTPPEELNRTLRTFYRTWQSWRSGATGSAPFPFHGLEPLVPFVSIVEATGGADALSFRYRTVGSALVENIGINLAERPVGGAVDDEHRSFLTRLYRDAALGGCPIYVASAYATEAATVATERLFLPLSTGAAPAREILVVQTFDRMDTQGSIYEILQRPATRRDFVRHIDPSVTDAAAVPPPAVGTSEEKFG
jgi:CheY-like chemotaxis protein